jgi:predicted transcriptional regulator
VSEEVKIKISQPMFEVGELERFDNNIHSIVEEYSKLMFKEKDQILTQRIIMKQEEEIERLNNNNQDMQKEMARTWKKYDELQDRINKAIEFVDSMEYCGQEDYFYDLKASDVCGNDNTFNDSKYKLLKILKGEDKE